MAAALVARRIDHAAPASQSSKVNDMRDLSHREMKSVAISSRTMDLSDTYLCFKRCIGRRQWSRT